MTYDELIERLDPAVYQSLKRGIELGKWPDGRPVTKEQRAICMEAVLYYERKHDIPEEQRVGYIDRRRADGSQAGPKGDTDRIRILN
ncbi:MAG: DUF1315 family protein [Marinobacter sp.]|uniref:YeaC family protein n=1 Tax=Marinobacter sp. TaxID=50741 RepID=UPI00299CF56F|nr:DUF1315 family protein [Marinobacter sp.]MDX1633808.1 DUF1315 family protein [Marinobacter sp.]